MRHGLGGVATVYAGDDEVKCNTLDAMVTLDIGVQE